MAESDLLYNELTRKIIGAAMEVHRTLGPGFLESVYEESLAYEFELQNIYFKRQEPISVYYKDRLVKDFICDFIVENKVIVEIKAIKNIGEIDIVQVINYLKSTDSKVGLLLNFGASSLQQ